MVPKFRPKILDYIVIDGKKIGYIAGINLKPIDYEDEDTMRKYIESISKLKEEDCENIFSEEMEYLDEGIKKTIEMETSLSFSNGKNIRLYNLPMIIEDLGKRLNRDFRRAELLLISQNREEILDVIYSISHIFNFISLIGIGKEEGEEVYSTILDDIGISIFQPINLESTLKNYDIIVNLEDKVIFDIKGIGRNTLVFDFSILKPFKILKKNVVIDDIKMYVQSLGTMNGFPIEQKISSSLYEGLFGEFKERYCQISTRNDDYSIEEYIEQIIRIKGGF